ncbi:MAG TPA: hypothetical protein VN709_01495 [Terriglobales bacterium]|nr:hypothetical protein [Terriglobales bacterium]
MGDFGDARAYWKTVNSERYERYWEVAPPAARKALERDPSLRDALRVILENSDYLTEALVQSPEWLLWLDRMRTSSGRAREDWASELASFLNAEPQGDRARRLTVFQRREYLRIVWRDLRGVAPLAETVGDLSALADAILAQAYAWNWNDLAARYGTPRGEHGASAEMVIVGLGKLGGNEVNYSSDLDLMFVYSVDGETAGGAETISNKEFFIRLAQSVVAQVADAYRIDLRLRPGGREGDLALSLRQAEDYYQQARDWEWQMLIRARACAGSLELGQQFLEVVSDKVYPPAPDEALVAAGVRTSREGIAAQLERHRALGRRTSAINVKLDAGGIRDIEFLVQFLQRLHGGGDRWVRQSNTLLAMQRLHDKRRLSSADFQLLSSAYVVLRQIEHRLQMRRGQQTHTLPDDAARLQALARGFDADDADRWLETLRQRMRQVRALYDSFLGREAPAPQPAPAAPIVLTKPASANEDDGLHLQRQWQRLLRSAATLPEADRALRSLPQALLPRLAWALGTSDWMAETLIRRPELAAVWAREEELEPGASLRLRHLLRLLRLLDEEWQQRWPIARTLAAHSHAAEVALAEALAGAQTTADAPSFAVLALGRLGLDELDLLSDLDLVFVAEEGELEAATKLAARFIEAVTAYTREGSLYAVDTRLRPAGGEGELVQTPASLGRHFTTRASEWEACSYLKARHVAGATATAGAALGRVGQALAERFSGEQIAREALQALRNRIEREGHPGRWGLKTAPGGYYDVDFIVSRHRLAAGEGATVGLAVTSLGAQARCLEDLPAEVATELGEAVELLRACDHALRVATGKAGGAIPAAGAAVARAEGWLRGIWPGTLAQDLTETVEKTRARIREIYTQWL